MALVVTNERVDGLTLISSTLLTGVVGVGNGEWIESAGKRCTVSIEGISGDTIHVRGSNAPTKPADATHGSLIGAAVTADGTVEITAPYRWIKARMTIFSAGSVTAYLLGATP